MSRWPWWLRDVAGLAIAIVVLIAAGYGLERIPIGGIAYYNRVIVLMGINVMLAVSLNIINGHAGQFSLGHAGFMAIGAYFSAFVSVFYFSPIIDTMPEGTPQLAAQNGFLLLSVLLGGGLAAVE